MLSDLATLHRSIDVGIDFLARSLPPCHSIESQDSHLESNVVGAVAHLPSDA